MIPLPQPGFVHVFSSSGSLQSGCVMWKTFPATFARNDVHIVRPIAGYQLPRVFESSGSEGSNVVSSELLGLKQWKNVNMMEIHWKYSKMSNVSLSMENQKPTTILYFCRAHWQDDWQTKPLIPANMSYCVWMPGVSSRLPHRSQHPKCCVPSSCNGKESDEGKEKGVSCHDDHTWHAQSAGTQKIIQDVKT